jgi:hypothetical protein
LGTVARRVGQKRLSGTALSDHPSFPDLSLPRARELEAVPVVTQWSAIAARYVVKRTFQEVAWWCQRVIDRYPYVGVLNGDGNKFRIRAAWPVGAAVAPRRGSAVQDELAHVAVGDRDPSGTFVPVDGYRTCGFEWADDTSPTLILVWSCTREEGHQGQHLAGTGEWVVAVHSRP